MMNPSLDLSTKATLPMNAPIREDLEALALSYRNICVVGLGYVGLPTALLFALHDFSVQGVDVSERVLDNIQHDRIGSVYPELADWWQEVRAEGHFKASSKPEPADVFLITVPTPVHHADKTCDLSMVRAATESILPVLRPGNLVILESTVPPGTTRNVLKPLIEEKTGLRVGQDIYLCFSPERVLPGNTTYELIHNHRVIGGTTPEAAIIGRTLLGQVMQGELFITTDVSAEFCKLAENTYRDVNIALANELSILADEYGVDMTEARQLINMHPRVNLLKPGIGVGGHCIAVDPWFFVEASPINTRLIATSRLVNDRMPDYTVQKILQAVADIERPKVVLVGLSYKPDVADTRESPAMRVVELLQAQTHVEVITYDPLLEDYAELTLQAVAEGADYLAVLVGHTAVLESLDLHGEPIRQVMRTPRIQVF
ncbi:nucleotide sugar dehydrogenase [Vampirovibrio chlorellavorus]|uniref:nucleotide sugar dehydrogenase n=1 Tax=Vampirovibrio chlorellavorus TaxID=758823 RepID=UPI0026F11858|nr:nucleotide sugar dehydrogenase [Vampirovibrio chlorellavorus]